MMFATGSRMCSRSGRSLWWLLLGAYCGTGGVVLGAEEGQKSPAPATAAEVAKLLDLEEFPLMEGAEAPSTRRLANLTYEAKGTVADAFEFQKKALAERGWSELPGGYSTEQAASGTFAREGFTVSVSAFPGAADKVRVSIGHHGNVELAKLPVPMGAKPLYAGPVSAIFASDLSPKEASATCRELLLAQGWEPYGTAGDSLIFRRGAVRLNAMVAAAPAQGGKTAISYTADLMSAEIPAPAEADQVHYADSTKALSFDTKMSPGSLLAFYRDELAKSGWKPTTESPIEVGFKESLIFANPGRDILDLEMHPVAGMLRVRVRHQSAAEVAESGRTAKAKSARMKAANRPEEKPKVILALPAEAKDVQATASRIAFTVPSGKAKAAAESLRAGLRRAGWKEDLAALEGPAGAVSLSKEGSGSLTISYTDTGITPAEIEVSATGAVLERAKPRSK